MKMTISRRHMNLVLVPPSPALAPRVVITQRRYWPTAAYGLYVTITRRRYCPTARSWSQEAPTGQTLSGARNCIILPLARGPRPAILEPDAILTQQRYCLTVLSWSQEEPTVQTLWRAQNCMIPPLARGTARLVLA